jgi:hypothetical protein
MADVVSTRDIATTIVQDTSHATTTSVCAMDGIAATIATTTDTTVQLVSQQVAAATADSAADAITTVTSDADAGTTIIAT